MPNAFVTDVNAHGGIGRTVRFIGACEAMGIDFWCYSANCGIGSAVYLHLCAAFSWIREPNQSLFRMQPLDVVEEGPYRPENNIVRVPETPGIGVTLSRDKLAHCHKMFLDEGPYDQHHDPDEPGRFKQYATEPSNGSTLDLGIGAQLGDQWCEAGLEEDDLAVEISQDLSVALSSLTGVDGDPGQVRAPQAEGADPRGDVVARPHRSIGLLRETLGQQGVRDRVGQFTGLLEGVADIVLDVGYAGRG